MARAWLMIVATMLLGVCTPALPQQRCNVDTECLQLQQCANGFCVPIGGEAREKASRSRCSPVRRAA